jgi:hypothetical protein
MKKGVSRAGSVLHPHRQAQRTMRTFGPYFLEHLLLWTVILLTVSGFWGLYFGAGAAPGLHHHLHVVTNFIWLLLLLFQLSLIGGRKHADHRKVGLSILVLGPLLFATTAALSVHSAHRGLISGEGDFLIVQNVGVTLEFGLLVLLAFVFRRRRKLHGSFLLSTAILFMGIALFFTLIGFVPQFRIEGPETFHRFQTAAITGQAICLAVGLLFFIRDFRNGWPFLLASSFFVLNELLRSFLDARGLLQPLTEFVGSMNQSLAFIGSFAALLVLLSATGILSSNRPDSSFRPDPLRGPA